MLNSRYIHLHEALGLGAMWLKQGAKIIDLPNNSPSPPRREVAPPKPSTAMPSARLAVLQKINSATLPAPEPSHTVSENASETTLPIYPVEYYLEKLSGSLKPAKVMALSVCASPADVMAGQLLSGADGALFHKMLAAIHLQPEDVHLSSWLKDLPNFQPKPSTEIVQAAAPRVLAEWRLCGAQALLLMGDFFERDDVKACLPEAPTFVIAHPQRILGNSTLKRPAWEVLQALQNYLSSIKSNI